MANLAFAITVDALDALKNLGSVGKAFVDLTKDAQQFGKELANINSIAFLSDKALGQLKDNIVNLSKSIPTAGVTELSQGLYQLYSSGFQGSKALDVLSMSAKAATAGMSTIAESSTVIASVLNSYGQDVLSANKATDLLLSTVQLGVTTFPELATSLGNVLPTAASAKVSFEETTAAIIELTKNGVPTAQAMTALNQVMLSLLDPTPEVAKLAKNLGLEFGATALASKGLNGVLQDVMKASNGNIEVMAGLFGSVDALKGAMILTKNAGKDFSKSIEEQGKASGATQKSYDEQMKSYDASIKTLQNSISIMKTEFGEMAIKVLKPMVENFSSLIQLFNDTDKTTKQVTVALSVLTFTISSLIIAFKALNAVIIQHTTIGIIAHLQNMTASMILFTGSVSASIVVISAGAVAIAGLIAIGYQFMKMQQAKKQAQEDENRNTEIYNSHIERRKELEEKQRKGIKLTKDETLDLAKAYRVLATEEGVDVNLKKRMMDKSDELIAKSKQFKDVTKEVGDTVKLTDKELESMIEQGKLSISGLTDLFVKGKVTRLQYNQTQQKIIDAEKKRSDDLKREQEKRKNDYINAQKEANETAKELQRSRIEQQEDSLKKEVALIKNSYQAKVDEQNELAKKGANVKSNIVEIRRQEQVAIAKITEKYNQKEQDRLKEKFAKEFEVAQLRASLIDDEVKKENYLYNIQVDNAKKIYANDSTLTLRLQVLEKEHSAKIKTIKQSMYEESLKLRKEYNDALKSLQDIEHTNEEKFYDSLLQDSEEIIKEAEHRLSIGAITQKQYTNIVKRETEAQIVYIEDALKSSTLSDDKKFQYKAQKITLSRKLEKDAYDEEEKLRQQSLKDSEDKAEKEKKILEEKAEAYEKQKQSIINSLYAIGGVLRSFTNNDVVNFGSSLQQSLKDFENTGKAMEGDITAIAELATQALGSLVTGFNEYNKELENSKDSTRSFLSAVFEAIKDFPLVGVLAQAIEMVIGFFGIELPKDTRQAFEEYKNRLVDLDKSLTSLKSTNLSLIDSISQTLESKLDILTNTYENALFEIHLKMIDLQKSLATATGDQIRLIGDTMEELLKQVGYLDEKYQKDKLALTKENNQKLANEELDLAKLKSELIEDEIAQENFLYESTVENTKKVYADDKNLNLRLEVLEKQHNDKMKSLAEKRVSEGLKLAEKKWRAEKGFTEISEKELELTLKNNKKILDGLYEALDLFEKQREEARKKLPQETTNQFKTLVEQTQKSLDPSFLYQPIEEFERTELETRQRIENEIAEGRLTKEESVKKYQDLAVKRYLYMKRIEESLVKNTKERTDYEGKKYDAFKDYQDLALELYDTQTEVLKTEKQVDITKQEKLVNNIESKLQDQKDALDTYLKETEISLLKTASDFSDIINATLGNVANSAKSLASSTSQTTKTATTTKGLTSANANSANVLSEDTRSELLTKIANASGNDATVWERVSNAYNNRDDATLMNLANQFGISYKKQSTTTSTAKPSNSNMYAENYTTKSATSSTAKLSDLVTDKTQLIQDIANIMLKANTPKYETEKDRQTRLQGYIDWIKSFDDDALKRYASMYLGTTPRFATGGISSGGLVMTEPREMLLNDSQQKKLFNILNGQTTMNNSNSININIGNMSGNQQDINKIANAVSEVMSRKLLNYNVR